MYSEEKFKNRHISNFFCRALSKIRNRLKVLNSCILARIRTRRKFINLQNRHFILSTVYRTRRESAICKSENKTFRKLNERVFDFKSYLFIVHILPVDNSFRSLSTIYQRSRTKVENRGYVTYWRVPWTWQRSSVFMFRARRGVSPSNVVTSRKHNFRLSGLSLLFLALSA